MLKTGVDRRPTLGAAWLLALSGCSTIGASSLSDIQADLDRLRGERLLLASARRPDPAEARPHSSPSGERQGTATQNEAKRRAEPIDENDVADGASPRTSPLTGFRDTVRRDLRAAPADLWEDLKAVYAAPAPLAMLGLAYGGALTLQATDVDQTVEDQLGGDDVFSDDVNTALGVVGNPLTHLGLAGVWYLLGQQRQDDRTYAVGRKLISALIINDLSTLGLKLATSRSSPNGESFSFPSGHTSSTFTVASVLHQAYGPWAGAPLYGLGVLVAVERLDDEEHYLSDVLMGVAMGLVVGHTVGAERRLELWGGEIVPYPDPNGGSAGLAWHRRF